LRIESHVANVEPSPIDGNASWPNC
jgi:hypothetical protein